MEQHYKIIEITDRALWEQFVTSQTQGTFLQSWHWGVMQNQLGAPIRRAGILYNDDTLIGVCLSFVVSARRGRYVFIPYGPVWKDELFRNFEETSDHEHGESALVEAFKALILDLKISARADKASFIKCSPYWEQNENTLALLRAIGFHRSAIHSKPERTWILDITESETTLLQAMKKEHRYLIRQGEKLPVQTEMKNSSEGVELLYNMQEATASRHQFHPFSKHVFQTQFESFFPQGQCFLNFALFHGEPLAGAFIMIYGKTASYHYGASYKKYPKIPASYTLLWNCIKEAKRRGCEQFNFWGIAKEGRGEGKKNPHPFAGLTHFKKGFGGEAIQLAPCHDLPLSLGYLGNYIVEYCRKWKRGF